jgi:hypothetical protein
MVTPKFLPVSARLPLRGIEQEIFPGGNDMIGLEWVGSSGSEFLWNLDFFERTGAS